MKTFAEILEDEKPVLVDFYADWCGPCKMMAPVIKKVKQQLGDDVVVLKIDVDKNATLSNEYQIRSIPTLILFHEGKLLWRQSGVVTKEQILKVFQQHIKDN